MVALRLGHLMAAAALATGGDVPTAPDRTELDRLLTLDEEEWSTLRLG